MKFEELLFCTLSIFLLSACTHFPLANEYKGPKQLPASVAEEYAYSKFSAGYEEQILKQEETYTLRQVKFRPSRNILGVEHDIYIDYYDPGTAGKKPVIMVLPILGGGNEVEDFFASYFTKHGYAAVFVRRQDKYKEIKELAKIDLVLRQVVLDHKQAIDWIETRPELDAGKIGVFGISMGAINGALLASLDKRIKASVLALVGGDISYMFCYSAEKGIVEKKNEFLARKGWNLEQFRGYLKENIKCDPLNYAEYLDARNVLLFLAIFDDIVLYHKGEELRKKMGEPETIYLMAGHYTSLLYILYARYECLKFFQKRF